MLGGPNGHSVDLIALSSNVLCAPRLVQCCCSFLLTQPLLAMTLTYLVNLPTFTHRFCSPIRTIFSADLPHPQFLRFMSSFPVSFTIVVPDDWPRPFWWALLPQCPSFSLLLARKGQVGVLNPPSKSGYQNSWPLPWDLWAFGIDP